MKWFYYLLQKSRQRRSWKFESHEKSDPCKPDLCWSSQAVPHTFNSTFQPLWVVFIYFAPLITQLSLLQFLLFTRKRQGNLWINISLNKKTTEALNIPTSDYIKVATLSFRWSFCSPNDSTLLLAVLLSTNSPASL